MISNPNSRVESPEPFVEARYRFHSNLKDSLLKKTHTGIPHNADKDSKTSVNIACSLLRQLGAEGIGKKLAPQTSGTEFEKCCQMYLQATFPLLRHIRPGEWEIERNRKLEEFEQYAHLAELDQFVKDQPRLGTLLGDEYRIKPDVVVIRRPEADETINNEIAIVGARYANHTPLRCANSTALILHATISCKWTIRSDRSQNARTEALNLIRNRKGRLPHIAALTAEPLPSRINSLAQGTGDFDCVYHFALPELQKSVEEIVARPSDGGRSQRSLEAEEETLTRLIEGGRLRDISDLPFDLVV